MQKRKVHVAITSEYSVETLWRLFADIHKYPERITFVKKVVLHEVPGKGARWDDITTILFVPMKMPHVIVEWEEKRRIVYDVLVPFRGMMRQTYTILPDKKGTKLAAEIEFFLGHRGIDHILGPLLEKRLRYMLLSSYEKVQK